MIPNNRDAQRFITGLALFLTFLLSGCGSQKSQIRHAYEAAFPGGHEVCFGVPFGYGLPREDGTVFYPSDGITSPLHHIFLFYVGLADAPVPDDVRFFLNLGLIQRHDVTATRDQESSYDGPELISPSGFYHRDAFYHHTLSHFVVSFYTTAPEDPGFSYDNENPFDGETRVSDGDSLVALVFPSRVFDNPLPPADADYSIPLVTQYVISTVSGECYTETLDQITAIRQSQGVNGHQIVQADVLLQPHAPDWMKAAAFRSFADPNYGSSPSVDTPRQATLDFEMVNGTLRYIEEEQGGL